MAATGSTEPRAAGEEALARCDWEQARRHFAEAVRQDETADAQEGLSWAAWYLDDADTAIAAREAAYRIRRRSGDRAGAARMAIWAAVDYLEFRGAVAVAQGWLARADRLLDGIEPAPEHGWLHLHRGAVALELEGDVDAAKAHAEQAIEIGRRVADCDVELIGLALEGLSLVAAGRVRQGMPLLDEAAAAALAGELEAPVSTGWARCYVIYGCEFVRDHDRAAQWCEETAAVAERLGLRYLFRVCRTHLAGVMVGYGEWAEAERELREAIDQLRRTRPGQAVEGSVRLAELRRRQGRLDEAVELFGEAAEHPLAAVGLAAVAADRGEAEASVELADRTLRSLPPGLRALRVLPLELLARGHAALGDLAAAESHLGELEALSEEIGTAHVAAAVRACNGALALARGEPAAAREELQAAVTLYTTARSPYEAAVSRSELAAALAATGRAQEARGEAGAAAEALDGLGATVAARRARERVEGPATAGAGDLSARELEVLRLVAEGLKDDAIARRLVLSEHTVHRHLANIRAKLRVSSRAAAVAKAARNRLI